MVNSHPKCKVLVALRESWVSKVVLEVKNPPASAGDRRDMNLIPELGRSPQVGNGTLLQYTCLENSMNRGAWRATVHRVAKSQTWLKWLSMHPFKGVLRFTVGKSIVGRERKLWTWRAVEEMLSGLTFSCDSASFYRGQLKYK